MSKKIVPCLWFDNQAEQAANYYTSIFKNSKIRKTTHYGEVGKEIHGREPGSVLTVEFDLDGNPFTALNGGPIFKFTEAVSFMVMCDDQKEIDYFWDKLTAGGDPTSQQCGWLKDKYGVSWQIIHKSLPELVGDPKSEKSQRAMAAMLEMKKIDIAALERAYEGK